MLIEKSLKGKSINTSWLFLVIGVNLMLLVVCAFERNTSPILLSGLLFLSGIILLKKSDHEVNIFLIVFSASVVYTLFLYYYYISLHGAPFFNVPLSDDSSYERDGLEYIEKLGLLQYRSISPTVVENSHNSKGYVYVVAVLAKVANSLGGYHTLIPRVFNAFIHAFCAVFVYRLANNFLKHEDRSFKVAILFGLLPYLLYLSGHIFRDTLVCFSFVFCIYTCTKEKTRLIDWCYVLLVLVGLSQLRFFSLIMVIACLMVFAYQRINNKWVRYTLGLTVGVGVLLVFFVLSSVFNSVGFSLWDLLLNKQKFYTDLRTGADYSTGIAGTILKLDFLPFGIFARSIYLTINPLPFLELKLPLFINGLGTFLQVTLFAFGGLFTLKNFRNKKFLILFVSVWLILVGIALSSFQPRHMVMFYPSLFVLGALGYYENYENKKLIRNVLFWGVSVGVFGIWLYMNNKLV